jgi:hypothetical protein
MGVRDALCEFRTEPIGNAVRADLPSAAKPQPNSETSHFSHPIFHPPLSDCDQRRVMNSGVKNPRSPRAIENAAASVPQGSADRKIDDKTMAVHCNSLRLFCHQSFCRPVAARSRSRKIAHGAKTSLVCNADQKEKDGRRNDFAAG